MYSIGFRASALAELSHLPKNIQKQVDRKISRLAENPRPVGVEKLKGSGNAFRIRSGDYRIVYELDDQNKTVVVGRVRHRKDAYRNL